MEGGREGLCEFSRIRLAGDDASEALPHPRDDGRDRRPLHAAARLREHRAGPKPSIMNYYYK